MATDSAALTVEDYAYASVLAGDVVDRAKQREFLVVMQRYDNAIRMAMNYPPLRAPSERERVEGLLHRINLHVRSHP